jgi:hypothetical protein
VPIRAELKKFYGKEWRAFRLALIAAHGAVCAHCGRTVPAYLNLAHITHDVRTSHVALLCAACHCRHDARHRLAIWRRNRARRHGQLWLSTELEYAPYPTWLIPPRVVEDVLRTLQIDLF